jgi:hypothetical protein
MSPNRSTGRLQGASFPSEVGPNLIVIGRVFREDSPKVLGVEHQQMVRALGLDRWTHRGAALAPSASGRTDTVCGW